MEDFMQSRNRQQPMSNIQRLIIIDVVLLVLFMVCSGMVV
jgi:hypothetical protein